MPTPQKEINLKGWGSELIQVCNVFNRGFDENDKRLSQRVLRILGHSICYDDIINAVMSGDRVKIKELAITLGNLNITEEDAIQL